MHVFSAGSNAKVAYRIHLSAPQPIPPYYWPTGALAYAGDAVSNQASQEHKTFSLWMLTTLHNIGDVKWYNLAWDC